MLRSLCYILLPLAISLLVSCSSGSNANGQAIDSPGRATANTDARAFPERFEKGHKMSYAPASVSLATGLWQLDDALIGKTDKDLKNGAASLRIRSGGSVSMLFDIPGNVGRVSFSCGTFGADAAGACSLYYSTDSGAHWQQQGSDVNVPGALHSVGFAINKNGPIRFRIQVSGSRLNVDDVSITDNNGRELTGSESRATATRKDNLALGNPSNATTDIANKDNYLLVHPQYTLSYNNAKGMANWVSWHLSTAWMGAATRCNCFMSDDALPDGFFHALTSNYIASGFDRGHLCPSDDRTASPEENAVTFLMSNMSPQAPFLNQQTWEGLEEYARALANSGHELYIIAGGYGQGGSGSRGGNTATIAGGSINVPAHFWKILLVLPTGGDDLKRITPETRVIAVDMPNVQSVNEHSWTYYRTSVHAIEQATGYDFFNKIPKKIQAALEAKVDSAPAE